MQLLKSWGGKLQKWLVSMITKMITEYEDI